MTREPSAYEVGRNLGEAAGPAGDAHAAAALAVLEAHGYEPRVEGPDIALVNCPFHTLAQEHTELVCGMNLRLLDGVLDGLDNTGLTAHLHPTSARLRWPHRRSSGHAWTNGRR